MEELILYVRYHAKPGGREAFVRHMQALKASGAALLGGCCGTTPEFIAAMRSLK